MENRFNHTDPEEQGWGKYVTPPPTSGPPSLKHYSDVSSEQSLCGRVREMLPSLLENDGEIRPEMRTALYGHLSACPSCNRELQEMQRVVAMLDALAPAEMPMDFSGLIMQRLQQGQESLHDAPLPRALHLAVPEPRPRSAAQTTGVTQQDKARFLAARTPRAMAVATTQSQQMRTLQTTQASTTIPFWERLTLVGVLSAVLAFFLRSAWGREILGVNMEAASAWLTNIGEAIGRVPLLDRIAFGAFAALTQAGDLLGNAYNSLGEIAARGLALDIALCAGTYYFLVSRRQRGQWRGA